MFAPVTLPFWLFVLILVFAGMSFLSHFLFPSVRWFFRRRMERVVAQLNTRLARPITPFKLMARNDMIVRLVHDPKVVEAVAEAAAARGVPASVEHERARRYAREIVPAFSATVYFGFAARAARALTRALYRVRLGRDGAAALSELGAEATVVFVMNHRSNMDYVLATYLASGRTALSYAVGEWARVWPLSALVRASGAYFIRRKSSDPLYRRVLARYVQMATEAGVTQAIFPEGGLSVDGRVGAAKLGILSYIMEAWRPDGRDVVFVPVALSYDRVFEDAVLVKAAAAGNRRFRAPILPVLWFLVRNAFRKLAGRYKRFGYAAVSLGKPVSLAGFAAEGGEPTVERLAGRIMERILDAMPVLPVPLAAAALGDTGAAEEAELQRRAEAIAEALSARGDHLGLPGGRGTGAPEGGDRDARRARAGAARGRARRGGAGAGGDPRLLRGRCAASPAGGGRVCAGGKQSGRCGSAAIRRDIKLRFQSDSCCKVARAILSRPAEQPRFCGAALPEEVRMALDANTGIAPYEAPEKELYAIGEMPPLGYVPPKMHAWCIRRERHGEPDTAMQVEVVETPEIGDDEALVLVMAAGVNYNGVWAALGLPISPFDGHRAPYHIAGSDASGIVWKVGAKVRRWKVGDEVVIHCNQDDGDDEECNGGEPMFSPSQRIWGYETPDGSFAQFTRVQARQLMQRPKHLTWEEAACYTLTLATTYRMLFGHKPHELQPGQNVLVWGASGGLGSYAIQLINTAGANAIAVISDEDKRDFVMGLGAKGVINRKDFTCWGQMPTVGTPEYAAWFAEVKRFGKAIWDITGKGVNVDMVFEHPGEATFPVSVFVVKRGGMVVICAGTTGFNLTLDARYLWMHQKRVQGSHFANLKQASAANKLMLERRLDPCMSEVFPWAEIPAAHVKMRRNQHKPGNMAVLVQAPRTGLRTFEDALQAGRTR